MDKEILIANVKVLLHKVTEIIQLYSFNKGKTKLSAINKRMEVRNIGKEYNCNILVETGTYLGEMIEFQSPNFKKIYSIEISDFYYNYSKNRLKRYSNIHIEKGDSGKVLDKLVNKINENDRVLYWLDGHYSGGNTGKGESESPIIKELEIVFATKRKDVILIDDAREFTGKNGYPTLDYVKELSESNNRLFKCYNDIIRLIPKDLV